MKSIFVFRSKSDPELFLIDCISISYRKSDRPHKTKYHTALGIPKYAANSDDYRCKLTMSWTRKQAEEWLSWVTSTVTNNNSDIKSRSRSKHCGLKFDSDAWRALFQCNIEVVEFVCQSSVTIR